MKNTQRGFIVPLLIAIVAVLVVGGGVYFYWLMINDVMTNDSYIADVYSTSTPQIVTTSDWKTYADTNKRFSIKYPSTWTYQKFSCNIDGVAFYPVGFAGVTCGMDSPVAPVYVYPKPAGQQTPSSSVVLSTQFSGNSSYKSVYNEMVKTFISKSNTLEPSITIVSPNGGESYKAGDIMKIVWKSKDLGNEKLSIRLVNGKNTDPMDRYPVVSSISNTGSYDWKILSSVPSGNYRVVIQTPEPANSDWEGRGPLALGISSSDFNIYTTTPPTFLPTSCTDQLDGMPVITSLSSYSGPVGTKLEVRGCNFAGFESDLNVWVENSQGVKGIAYAEAAHLSGGSTAKLLKITLAPSLCQKDNSYSALPCQAYLNLTPGLYKIYTAPWGKKSNEIVFTIQ